MNYHSNTKVFCQFQGADTCQTTIGRLRNRFRSAGYTDERIVKAIDELTLKGTITECYAIYTIMNHK
jgi:hypothetical protein